MLKTEAQLASVPQFGHELAVNQVNKAPVTNICGTGISIIAITVYISFPSQKSLQSR